MKPLIVANWKMHKPLLEAVQYVEAAGEALNQLNRVEVVLCPPFTALAVVEGLLRGTGVRLGAQNISAWKEGAYTGEVSAEMVAPHCHFAIIGHSERRRWCGETSEVVKSKVRRAVEAQLEPIVCVSNEEELQSLEEIRDKVRRWIVAFEPLEAIGSGKPEDPDSVRLMTRKIRQVLGSETRVLYGGSVTPDNVRQYVRLTDGALVGGASLDPESFVALCRKAA